MSPRLEREAEMDSMSDHAQRFSRVHISIPETRPPERFLSPLLATNLAPRRNLCAEFSALSTEQLLAQAEAAMVRLDRAGRPTDYAVVVALVRRLAKKQALDGTIWLERGGAV